MSKIRCEVPDDFMRKLQQALGCSSSLEVTQEAFTFLAWAVDERRKGRVILSSEPNGSNVERLAMRALQRVEKY